MRLTRGNADRSWRARTLRDASYVLLSGVCVAPLVVLTAVNATLQWPPLFFLSLVLYALVFVFGGATFECWRTARVLGAGRTASAARRPGRTAGYALVTVLTGVVPFVLLVGWLVLVVRNVLLYPLPGVGEWGAPYPDPSWGGPTWQGAIALHTGGALVSLLAFPWVVRGFATVQAGMVRRFLGCG